MPPSVQALAATTPNQLARPRHPRPLALLGPCISAGSRRPQRQAAALATLLLPPQQATAQAMLPHPPKQAVALAMLPHPPEQAAALAMLLHPQAAAALPPQAGL